MRTALLLALPLLAVAPVSPADAGRSTPSGLGAAQGDGGLIFEPAASEPLPTSCGPETEAAMGVAHFREAARGAGCGRQPRVDAGVDAAEAREFRPRWKATSANRPTIATRSSSWSRSASTSAAPS